MEATPTETAPQNATGPPSETAVQPSSMSTPAPPKSFPNGVRPTSTPEGKPPEPQKEQITPAAPNKIAPSILKRPLPSTSTQSKSSKQSPKHFPAKQPPAKQPPAKQPGSEQTSNQANSSNGQAANNNDPDITKMKRSLCKVVVSGYPTFSKSQDLQKLFSQFGHAKVELINRKFAVVVFQTPEEAKTAVEDSMKVCLYGQFLSIKPHTGNEDYRKQNKNNKVQVGDVIPPPERLSFEGTFEEQLQALLAAVRLTQEEVLALAELYGDVERVLQPLWPGCQAMPFGSLTTGLGVKSSDADCFVNIPPQYRHAQFSFVSRARRALQQFPQLFGDVIAIPRANTPIVKLLHLPTRTRCDVSFKTPLGALNSKLVAFLLHSDPRFLPLAVALKYWAGAHRLSGTGRLTNYALTLMVLFYLQRRGLLPPVRDLQRDPAHRVLVDHWDSGFAPEPALLPRPDPADPAAADGVDGLLGGFFVFYDRFDWDALVVCPYLGRPVPKELFAECGDPPEEFARYRRNVEEGIAAPLRVRVPLCVQDPLEQAHNVASAVTSRLAADLRAFLAFAAETYAAERAAGCRGLLRALLLERPRVHPPRPHPEFRVHLPTRPLEALPPVWRSPLRDAVELAFERALAMPLASLGPPERTRNRRERERYESRFDLPLWRRARYAAAASAGPAAGFAERQRRVTEALAAAEARIETVRVEVSVSYGLRARGAWVAVRLEDGDPDAFHRFGRYYLAAMPGLVLSALAAKGAAPSDPAEGDVVDYDSDDDDDYDDDANDADDDDSRGSLRGGSGGEDGDASPGCEPDPSEVESSGSVDVPAGGEARGV